MTFKVNVEISRKKQYEAKATVTLLAILLALPGFTCLQSYGYANWLR